MFAIAPRHASDPLTGATPVDYAYDSYGRPSSLTPGNGQLTTYSFDPVGRVSRVNNQGLVYSDFTYNPASQIVTRALSNGNWAWDEGLDVDLDYEVNNLNQYGRLEEPLDFGMIGARREAAA